MIKFTYDSLWCRIDGDYPFDVVSKATSYTDPQAYFIKKMSDTSWDGRHRLMEKRIGSDGTEGYHFPTGLIYHVQHALMKVGHSDFVNQELYSPLPLQENPIQLDNGLALRDYQLESIERIKTFKRGILHLATASGKTLIAAAFTQYAGLPTLFMVYGTDLVYQAYDKYHEYLGTWLKNTGRKVGIMSGAKEKDIDGDIVVASVSKLARMRKSRKEEFLNFVRRFHVLILDEVHGGGAKNFYNTCMCIPAYYRVGLSGTPTRRGDNANKRVFAITGPIIHRVSNRELVMKDIIAKTTIEFVPMPYPKPTERDPWLLNPIPYSQLYHLLIVQNEKRNEEICNIAVEAADAGKNVIILIREIEHGYLIQNMINATGRHTAEYLFGEATNKHREEIKAKFRSKELSILIASTIFDQGVDFPNIDTLILGGGGTSYIRALQRIGRGLRGKYLHVIDFADKMHSIFKEQTKERIKHYQKENAFNIIFSQKYQGDHSC